MTFGRSWHDGRSVRHHNLIAATQPPITGPITKGKGKGNTAGKGHGKPAVRNLGLADVDAPAAATASALWNLYPATYSGYCCRIYKGTDTATLYDIGFDSNGFVDISEIASICGSDDGFLVRMYDQLTGTQQWGRSSLVGGKIYDGATGQMVTDAGGVIGFEKFINPLFTQIPGPETEYGMMCRFSTTDTQFVIVGNSNKNDNYIGVGTSGSSSTAVCNNGGSLSVGRHYKNGVLQSIANRGDIYTTFADGNQNRYVGIAPLAPGTSSGNYAVIGEYPGNVGGSRMTPCFQTGYWIQITDTFTDTHIANVDAYLAASLATHF